MGANILSSKWHRKISEACGQTVIHAWVASHVESGRWAAFTTSEHNHGEYDRFTGEVEWYKPTEKSPCGVCWTSCRRFFPDSA